jgi:phosphoribosylanthranilate isomerase
MVKVKVCGITTPEDALTAAGFGADAIGLVFAESPRKLNVEQAREITATLPEGVIKVGVFVDEEPEEVLRTAREVRLDYAQLHGDESPETVTLLRGEGVKVIKALRVQGAGSLGALGEKARGGTGERFDWELAKSYGGRGNIVVSGGLTPENVREAIRFFEPYGVDASSSLEDAPGKKNEERVRRFVSAAKE